MKREIRRLISILLTFCLLAGMTPAGAIAQDGSATPSEPTEQQAPPTQQPAEEPTLAPADAPAQDPDPTPTAEEAAPLDEESARPIAAVRGVTVDPAARTITVESGYTVTVEALLTVDGYDAGYTVVVKGTLTGSAALANPVTNVGKIAGGSFTGAVYNKGTISGGTFSGSVKEADGRYAFIKGGTFTSSCSITFEGGPSTISGGTFHCAVNTEKLWAVNGPATFNGALTVASSTNIVGATINGPLTNHGTIGSSTITGEVTNHGTIFDCQLSSATLSLPGFIYVRTTVEIEGQGATVYNTTADTLNKKFVYGASILDSLNSIAASGEGTVWEQAIDGSDDFATVSAGDTIGLHTYAFRLDSVNWYFDGSVLHISGSVDGDALPQSGYDSVVVNAGGAITGGSFAKPVTNHGAITGGSFASVDNDGAVSGASVTTLTLRAGGTVASGVYDTVNYYGGMFSGEPSVTAVNNYGLIDEGLLPASVTSLTNKSGGTITSGDFTGVNVSTEAGSAISGGSFGNVVNYGTVSGGSFAGIDNRGQITDGSFAGTTVTNTKGATISGGTFSGLTNNGTIAGGSFSGAVANNGTITGGTFSGTVTEPSGGASHIKGGTFTGTVNFGYNEFISGGTYAKGCVLVFGGGPSSISRGVFDCDVDTTRLWGVMGTPVFNGSVTVASSTQVTGGTFNGPVINRGRISGGTFAASNALDVTVTNYATITGSAVISGTVNNQSGAVISGGTFNQPGILWNNSGATISGGTFYASVTNGTHEYGDPAIINGGTFYGKVTGAIYSVITGATFAGGVDNFSHASIKNAAFTATSNVYNDGEITRSTFSGSVYNDTSGKLNGCTLEAGSVLTNRGRVDGGAIGGQILAHFGEVSSQYAASASVAEKTDGTVWVTYYVSLDGETALYDDADYGANVLETLSRFSDGGEWYWLDQATYGATRTLVADDAAFPLQPLTYLLEETADDDPTSTPEPSQTPTPTEEPEQPGPTEEPEQPDPTKEPEQEPDPTQEPEQPDPTEEPEQPDPTEEPGQEPDPTQEPEQPVPTEEPEQPDPTEEPAATPGPTLPPEVTDDPTPAPDPTAAPAATPTPSATSGTGSGGSSGDGASYPGGNSGVAVTSAPAQTNTAARNRLVLDYFGTSADTANLPASAAKLSIVCGDDLLPQSYYLLPLTMTFEGGAQESSLLILSADPASAASTLSLALDQLSHLADETKPVDTVIFRLGDIAVSFSPAEFLSGHMAKIVRIALDGGLEEAWQAGLVEAIEGLDEPTFAAGELANVSMALRITQATAQDGAAGYDVRVRLSSSDTTIDVTDLLTSLTVCLAADATQAVAYTDDAGETVLLTAEPDEAIGTASAFAERYDVLWNTQYATVNYMDTASTAAYVLNGVNVQSAGAGIYSPAAAQP